MAEPFFFVNTYGIREGMSDTFQEQSRQVVELVRAEEPQMLYFGFFINEEGTEATTLQVHPDPDSMLFHMEVAKKHIEEAVDFVDFSNMSIGFYGTPNEAVWETTRQLAGTGVPIRVMRSWDSVNRLRSATA